MMATILRVAAVAICSARRHMRWELELSSGHCLPGAPSPATEVRILSALYSGGTFFK